MGIYDRGAEVGTGRWHVKLDHPDGMITFEDVQSDGIEDARAAAEALHPGYVADWAILEPFHPGVFGPGAPLC